MKHATIHSPPRPRLLTFTLLLSATALLAGCTSGGAGPCTFSSPDDAVKALTSGVRADDTSKLLAIMGPEGEQIISSGDEVNDRQRRQKFLELYDQHHSLVTEDPNRRTLIIGDDEWPFPIPIVKQGSKWVFDAAAGREEILNRRIGENELSAVKVCEAIADAQREYATRDPDGDGIQKYARHFASDPGKHNGLFWIPSPGEAQSPLGELVADAAGEGYTRSAEGPAAYHGYYYRILESQGPHAPNGALDYVVNGKMILGFAVVAWPAEYGSSGVTTFIMGPDGVVYQRDLGDDTEKMAKSMKAYDPGVGWVKVK